MLQIERDLHSSEKVPLYSCPVNSSLKFFAAPYQFINV